MKKRFSIVFPALFMLFIELVILLLVIFFIDSHGMITTYLLAAGVLLLLIAAMFFYFRIYKPVNLIEKKLSYLEKGEILQMSPSDRKNELGLIENKLFNHVKRLEELIQIMDELGDGKIDRDFLLSSANDELGVAVSKLKESIIYSNQEASERRHIDEQHNWAAQGLAKFGELMRNFEQDIPMHSNLFIKELTTYLDMEIGGFFLNRMDADGKEYLELEGAFAFDREKQLQKKFEIGEGLVGRCALEKESIIITDVPKEYIKIRSGMGEDLPSTLVLVPILLDEKVSGVIELASFSQVSSYKIEFLKTLGKSISASLTKVN